MTENFSSQSKKPRKKRGFFLMFFSKRNRASFYVRGRNRHLPSHCKISIRKRSSSIPPYWRNINPGQGVQTFKQLREWELVLTAKGFYYCINKFNGNEFIYVSPLEEKMARKEIEEFISENNKTDQKVQIIKKPIVSIIFIYLAMLVLWHALRTGGWEQAWSLPEHADWLALGALDSMRVRFYSEWYRASTALTLHSDFHHLLGNIFFGAIFLSILSRMLGPGKAIFLSIIGGVLGNCVIVLLRRHHFISIGFSTSLFACVGVLTAVMVRNGKGIKEALLPVGAALALLAMLGAEGRQTDYGAHIAGLLCGFFLGFFAQGTKTMLNERFEQIIALSLACFIPIASWAWVFILYDK